MTPDELRHRRASGYRRGMKVGVAVKSVVVTGRSLGKTSEQLLHKWRYGWRLLTGEQK